MPIGANLSAPPIPSAPGLPVLGNLIDFRRNLPQFLLRVSRERGDISRLQLGTRRLLFLNAPEYVGPVLQAPAAAVEKPAAADRARALILGNGLIMSDGLFHQRQRRLCAPAFHTQHLTGFAARMVDATAHLAATWTEGTVIDLSAEMARLTLGIAGQVLFGTDLLPEASELRQALTTVQGFVRDRGRGLWRLPLDWPTPAHRRFRAAIARLDATMYRLIAERQRDGAAAHDLLALLLAARDESDGGRMSARQVRDEALNLFWAGHEPTAIALTLAWYLLARHPAAYARLQAEVRRVLAGRPPGMADLTALPYTQQVFKETLRLYPPIFAFSRLVRQPLALPGYTLPAGSRVLISPYTLHRRAPAFPDPDRFDPERFAPEAEARRPRWAYLPFGSGPRFCPGSHLALLEGTLVLATLAQECTFELPAGQRLVPERLLLQPGRDRVCATVRRGGARP